MLVLVVLAICLSQISVYCQRSGPEVKTSAGLVVGLDVDHRNTTGAVYRAFLGVPYGNKPVRFQLPQRRSPWSGPLYAQQDGLPCPQPNSSGFVYSEDCLYLNVFTPPNSSSNSKFPVLLFIHGGAFTSGSSSSSAYSPDFLIGREIVVVTFNHRLGAIGYLTLGSSIAPGNLGLHDASLAMRWVQEEITMFGGDPSRVTLAGHSTGSITVNLLLLSHHSFEDGPLFSQVILLTGPALSECCHTSVDDAVEKAKHLARALDCYFPANDSATLSCLQDADIQHIVGNQSSFSWTTQEYARYFNRAFQPIVNDSIVGDSAFFYVSLDELTQEAAKRNIPMIIGSTRDEGAFFIDNNEYWKLVEDNLYAFIPLSVANKLNEEDRRSVVDKIREHYFPGGPDQIKIMSLVELYGDVLFNYWIVKTALAFRKTAFVYNFAYDGSWRFFLEYFSQFHLSVVAHADELPYIWYGSGQQYLDDCRDNLPNLRMKDLMVQMITDFIKTGNPSNDSIPWRTLAESNQYLVIDYEPSAVNASVFEKKHFELWADIEATVPSS